MTLTVPRLRERLDDIKALAVHFVTQEGSRVNRFFATTFSSNGTWRLESLLEQGSRIPP